MTHWSHSPCNFNTDTPVDDRCAASVAASSGHDIEPREVGLETAGVPGQQWPTLNGGVGSDEEVGQHLPLAAAAPAIRRLGPGRQEVGWPRNLAQFKPHRERHVVEGFKRREGQRDLSVDDRVDGQGMQLGLGAQHILNASVRQGTSARPRAASQQSRVGLRARPAGRAGWRTTSPSVFTENSTGAPGSSCIASHRGYAWES
jgi:hypothetical protein